MAPPKPIPCHHCREPHPPDAMLPSPTHIELVCERCYDDEVRLIRNAEAFKSSQTRAA